jgi:hypothetical protein
MRIAKPYNPGAGRKAWVAYLKANPGFKGRPKKVSNLSKTEYAEWIQFYKDAGGAVQDDDPVATPKVSSPVRQALVTACSTRTAVITGKVVSLKLLSDHQDSQGRKVLKKSVGDFKNVPQGNRKDYEYAKPEWLSSRPSPNSPDSSYPISHTKAEKIKIELKVEFKINFAKTLEIEIKGVCANAAYLTFSATQEESLSDGVIVTFELESEDVLPDYVTRIKNKAIQWTAEAEGKVIDLGATGPHEILVTYAAPKGTVISPSKHTFECSNKRTQDITYERLVLAVGASEGEGEEEKDCVDAVFGYLKKRKIFYAPGSNWPNNTGLAARAPELEHYLWKAMAKQAQAECHNLAAAFALMCLSLGVEGSFEVGYMYPWPRREDDSPYDPFTSESQPLKGGDFKISVAGAYYKQYHRIINEEEYPLIFIDGNGKQNAFEGVARYENSLYAIGEGIYGDYDNVHDNSSTFYLEEKDYNKGRFQLCFVLKKKKGRSFQYTYVKEPYGDVVKVTNAEKGTFYWHD